MGRGMYSRRFRYFFVVRNSKAFSRLVPDFDIDTKCLMLCSDDGYQIVYNANA